MSLRQILLLVLVAAIALPWVSADRFEIGTNADSLELREPVGEVFDTITEDDLSDLQSGHITTSEGETDYQQYLRLRDDTGLQDMAVNFIRSDEDTVSEYLIIDNDVPFLEWEIQFSEGLESEVENGELADLEDRSFDIMGDQFTIARATLTNGDDLEIVLLRAPIADTLRENETRTYFFDGVEYEITLVFVPEGNDTPPRATFSVNGFITQELEEGDFEVLPSGIRIGVRDILINSREGVASFFFGADALVLSDATPSVPSFDGRAELNSEELIDAQVSIIGANITSDSFEIVSIKYRILLDATSDGFSFIRENWSVRDHMPRPEALISDTLDVHYEGLSPRKMTDVEIRANGDDEYEMTFTNVRGYEYTFPLVSTQTSWKYGGDNDNLFFVESGSASEARIADGDYFIITNDRGPDSDQSVTSVLRYGDYDNDERTLEFEDLATGGFHFVELTAEGTGFLNMSGFTFAINVPAPATAEPNITIDLNGDGDIASDVVRITVEGGAIFDLARNVSPGVDSAHGAALFPYLSSGVLPGSSIEMSMTEFAKNFDTSSKGDGLLLWTLQDKALEVDLEMALNAYSGPLETPGSPTTEFQLITLSDDTDYSIGMTDFGSYVRLYAPASEEPNELHIAIPENQMYAQVVVELGETEPSSACIPRWEWPLMALPENASTSDVLLAIDIQVEVMPYVCEPPVPNGELNPIAVGIAALFDNIPPERLNDTIIVAIVDGRIVRFIPPVVQENQTGTIAATTAAFDILDVLFENRSSTEVPEGDLNLFFFPPPTSVCGNTIVETGETCSTCPADAGVCPAPPSNSGSSGGRGGGGGYVPPRINTTKAPEPVEAPEEETALAAADAQPAATEETAPEPEAPVAEPVVPAITGAVVGGGSAGWLSFTVVCALAACLLGAYSWRRKN